MLSREKWKWSVKAEVSLRPLSGSWGHFENHQHTSTCWFWAFTADSLKQWEYPEPESQPDLRLKSSFTASLRCLSLPRTLAFHTNPIYLVFFYPPMPWGRYGVTSICIFFYPPMPWGRYRGYIYTHFYEGFHTEKHLPQERKISKFMTCAFFYTYRLLAIYLFVKVRGCCLHYTHLCLSLKCGKTLLLLLLSRFSHVRPCATP